MTALAFAYAFFGIGALGAVSEFFFRGKTWARWLGLGGAIAGGAAAFISGVLGFTTAAAQTWSADWSLPAGGGLELRLDALAAVFLVPIGVIGAACALFGHEYLKEHGNGEAPGVSFALYNVLLASMTVVVTANDTILLVIAWELMTLSSWALVVSDHRLNSVRSAGLVYLTAAHFATAALLVLVLLLAADSGNFRIDDVGAAPGAAPGVLFVLALIAFGTKAGVVPLHVWLPDAHPAAPSHVSALMSAVMITMGFYGLARFLPLLGQPALWWAYLLIGLGVLGAIGGILFALAQRDVKRLLAYSTVENAGIATVALGVGLLGSLLQRPILAGFAWTAFFLHLWNHALVKAALFLGYGAIAQAAGSRQLDALGGLLHSWTRLGAVLIGLAAALAALPGMNMFVSEWLLFSGLLRGGQSADGLAQIALLAALVGLALASALAVACFARLTGIGLLGVPRSDGAARAVEPGWMMRGPVLLLAAASLGIAAFPAFASATLARAVSVNVPGAQLGPVQDSLAPIAWLLPALLAGTAAVALMQRLVSGRLQPARSTTWACGFPSSTPVMQYTGTSFSEPITRVAQTVLRMETTRTEAAFAAGASRWPVRMSWSSHVADRVLTVLYQPSFALVGRIGARIRAAHKPRVTTSIVYILLTVLLLLGLLFMPARTEGTSLTQPEALPPRMATP